MGNKFELIDTGKDCLNRISIALAVWPTINKWNLMKLKRFCMAKNTIIWAKWQPIELRKVFTNYISDKVLVSRINKEVKQNKQNSEIKKKSLVLKMWCPLSIPDTVYSTAELYRTRIRLRMAKPSLQWSLEIRTIGPQGKVPQVRLKCQLLCWLCWS